MGYNEKSGGISVMDNQNQNQMLCYQCGNTKEGKACNDTMGTCGKSAASSKLQDELTGALVGLAKACVHKSTDEYMQALIIKGLCATSANTCFDDGYIAALTGEIQQAKSKYMPKFGDYNTSLRLPSDFDIRTIWQKRPEIRSLKSALLFGIRGLASYVAEGKALGCKNKEAVSFLLKALNALAANHFKEDYYEILKELGEITLRTVNQTDKAKQTLYGSPAVVEVPRVIESGAFIVVSGNRFDVLKDILDQTNGTGVAVYSHGEMLSAHAYAEFRKYRHFLGHYGTAWENQQEEFDQIPAAVVLTSGCFRLPLNSYADRVFTAGDAYIGGLPHLDKDYSDAIACSINLGGAGQQFAFPGLNGGTVLRTGFGRKTNRTVSYKLAASLAEGKLHHIYVVGGCDGCSDKRGFYTDLIRRIPDDSVVITWGCMKFRFNDIDYGELDGVPRIIDMGSSSDFGAVAELIEAIASSAKVMTEELPLVWHFGWEEQKSLASFLALTGCDVRNIILGPDKPPFLITAVYRELAEESGARLLSDISDSNTTAKSDSEPDTVFVPEEDEITEEDIKKEDIKENIEANTEEDIKEALDKNTENTEAVLDIAEDFKAAEAEKKYEINIEEEDKTLPDWAVMEEDDEEVEIAAAGEIVVNNGVATIRPEDIDQTPDFAKDYDGEEAEVLEVSEVSEESEAVEEVEKVEEVTEVKAVSANQPFELMDEPVKVSIPKGKGVSGWHDSDDMPVNERFQTPPPVVRELVELAPAPEIVLPEGAGITGFAADKSEPAYEMKNEEDTLYSFAEPLPEIQIPKGKGVSGWKEGDDEFVPQSSGRDKEETREEKPWLKQSLERLHQEVELDQKAAEPIPSAVQIKAEQEEPIENNSETSPETTDAEVSEPVNSEKADSSKPWLERSLKELKESIEKGEDEEYTPSYKHDADAAESKPWLKQSLENLHNSIDEEAGIKTVRNDENAVKGEEKTDAEVAELWSNTPQAPKWGDLQNNNQAPAAEMFDPSAAKSLDNSNTGDSEPSGGGEPDQQWQKPPVLEKPWDKDLQTVWQKPEVTVKPWQVPANGDNAGRVDTGVYGQGSTEAEATAAAAEAVVQPEYVPQEQNYAADVAYAQQQAYLQQIAQEESRRQREYMVQQQALSEAAARQQQEIAEVQQARREQELYMNQLNEQAARLEEMRIRQEAESIRLQNQAAELHRTRQEQMSRMDVESYNNRRAQADYARQLQAQAEQIQQLQRQLNAARSQLEQDAMALERDKENQQRQAALLAEREEQLALMQQQAQVGSYGQVNPIRSEVNTGVSGSRYYQVPPALPTDYTQTCYGVPQKTEIIPMAPGSGVSGWADPNPPAVFPADAGSVDFFGFMNSTEPAGVKPKSEEIIAKSSGDEYIATEGPDGEIIMTIKQDK